MAEMNYNQDQLPSPNTGASTSGTKGTHVFTQHKIIGGTAENGAGKDKMDEVKTTYKNYNLSYLDDKICHCKCKQNCKDQFTAAEKNRIRESIARMTRQEKDRELIGILSTAINDDEFATAGKRQMKIRQRTYTRYKYGTKAICREMFLYLYQISSTKLTSMKRHFLKHRFAPYKKKSGGRRSNAMTHEQKKLVVQFICSYAEEHAIPLPVRIPGLKKDEDLKILPSTTSKQELYKMYCNAAAETEGMRKISSSTFKTLWTTFLPNIVICKQKKDKP